MQGRNLGCGVQQFLDDLLIGNQTIVVCVHQLGNFLRELLGLHHICTLEDGDLFRHQLAEDLHGDVFLLHLRNLFQHVRVEEIEPLPHGLAVKQVDNALALNACFQQIVDLSIDLLQRQQFAIASAHGQLDHCGADGLEVGGLVPLLGGGQAGA